MMNDKEKKAEYAKAYRLANKEKIAKHAKAYYLENRDNLIEKSKVWGEANKERKAARDKVYYEANKDKLAEYQLANRERVADREHKKIYGITLAECVLRFGTSCNNCGHTPVEGERVLNTDHCHDSNVVRGRLCPTCNVGIGMLGDNIEGLESAIRYLQRSELRCQ